MLHHQPDTFQNMDSLGILAPPQSVHQNINLVLCFVSRCCTDVREVFDLFDFWDGRDGMVDGAKVAEFLRCCGLNPTNKLVSQNGGTEKLGTIPLYVSPSFFNDILTLSKATFLQTSVNLTFPKSPNCNLPDLPTCAV